MPASFEGGQMPLHRRVPQLPGFSNLRFKTTYQVVNTGRLAALYPEGGEVTPENLAAKGAVRSGELVKLLGTGDVTAPLQVTACALPPPPGTRSPRRGEPLPRCDSSRDERTVAPAQAGCPGTIPWLRGRCAPVPALRAGCYSAASA